MSTTITLDATSLVPLLVTGYDSRRTSRNLLHVVLDKATPEVTLREAALRKGTLEILCADHAAALAMDELHSLLGVLTLTDSDIPALGMSYVVEGDIEVTIDPETQTRWIVRVGYAEVTP